jgi:hypothetical protein
MAKKSMLQLGEEKLAQEDVGTSPMTHDENLRANALALACRYYVETICKDGDLYREMVRDNKVLKPASVDDLKRKQESFVADIKPFIERAIAESQAPAKEFVHKYDGWPARSMCGAICGITSITNSDVTCEKCLELIAESQFPQPTPTNCTCNADSVYCPFHKRDVTPIPSSFG